MLRTIGLLLAALLLGASAQEQQQQDQGWRYEERKGDPGEWQTHRGGEGRRSGGGGRPHDLSEFPTVARQDTPRRGDEGLAPLDVRPALRVVYDIAVNFSTKSWGQHHEQHLYEQQQWQQRQKQQQQKQQQQQDAGEGRMYGNDSGIQLYKINIMNDGPGDVVQLATKVEDWNQTTSWWGVDTLDSNSSYVYLPKYRSPLRPGDVWTFGIIQHTNRPTFPKIEPMYGQTGDGRYFNFTSVIPSPPNPSGTNASLTVKDERESYHRGQRFVLFHGRIKNAGGFPLVNVGLDIDNMTEAAATWHLVYDPTTNTSYLPMRSGPLLSGAVQDFGFIMPLHTGFPNVSLRHTTTPNSLYRLTAPNVFDEPSPREMVAPGNGTTTMLEQAKGGIRVPYPPQHGRARGEDQQQEMGAGNAMASSGEQQQQQQQQQQQGQAGGEGNTTATQKVGVGGRCRILRRDV